MAEFGDALSTAITSQNENKPSLFEVVAQDNLNAAVRPAMKHIIKVSDILAHINYIMFMWPV